MFKSAFSAYTNANAGMIDRRYIFYSEWILAYWFDQDDYDPERVKELREAKYGKEIKLNETE